MRVRCNARATRVRCACDARAILYVLRASYSRHTRVILASYSRHTCVILASYLRHTCVILASSYLHHTCVILASYLHHTCVILAPYLRHTCATLAHHADSRLKGAPLQASDYGTVAKKRVCLTTKVQTQHGGGWWRLARDCSDAVAGMRLLGAEGGGCLALVAMCQGADAGFTRWTAPWTARLERVGLGQGGLNSGQIHHKVIKFALSLGILLMSFYMSCRPWTRRLPASHTFWCCHLIVDGRSRSCEEGRGD